MTQSREELLQRIEESRIKGLCSQAAQRRVGEVCYLMLTAGAYLYGVKVELAFPEGFPDWMTRDGLLTLLEAEMNDREGE